MKFLYIAIFACFFGLISCHQKSMTKSSKRKKGVDEVVTYWRNGKIKTKSYTNGDLPTFLSYNEKGQITEVKHEDIKKFYYDNKDEVNTIEYYDFNNRITYSRYTEDSRYLIFDYDGDIRTIEEWSTNGNLLSNQTDAIISYYSYKEIKKNIIVTSSMSRFGGDNEVINVVDTINKSYFKSSKFYSKFVPEDTNY